MDIQTKYISKFKSEKTFLLIYTDHFDDSTYSFVIDYNEEFLVLECFNEDGDYNGISILLRENITRIRWQGNDITSVFRLIDITKRIEYKNEIDLSTKETILKSVYRKYEHINVYIEEIDKDVCFIGQIYDLDSESIVINEFGTSVSLDRKFILLSL
ncbi:MAG: hypothetical protein EAZ31_04170, partial [Cytophagia bacterium]